MEEKMLLLKEKLEADEQLAKQLVSQETPEEAQALLKAEGIDFTIEEINQLGDVLVKAINSEDGELSDDDLDEVAGGVVIAAVPIAIAVGKAVASGAATFAIAKVAQRIRRW